MSNSQPSCIHPLNHRIRNKTKSHGYCLLCGSLLYFNSTNDTNSKSQEFFSFAKPVYLDKRTEIDPIDIFTILNQHYNETNNDINCYSNNSQLLPSAWYLKNRKKAIVFLTDIKMKYTFSDNAFYLALLYIDLLMFNANNLTNSKLELTVISGMLLAAKFIEKLNTEPNISRMVNLNSYYNEDDIIKHEMATLKKLEYRLNRLDSHGLFSFLLSNGFVFSREIQHKPSNFINLIYGFANKTFVDFILNSASLTFNPMQICFSVIHLTRKRFGLKPQNFKAIKTIYGYHYSSYKDCLNTIKLAIEKNGIFPSASPSVPSPCNTINKVIDVKAINSERNKQQQNSNVIQKISLVRSKSYCTSQIKKVKYISQLLDKEEEGDIESKCKGEGKGIEAETNYSTKAIRAKVNKSCKQLITKKSLNQLINII